MALKIFSYGSGNIGPSEFGASDASVLKGIFLFLKFLS